MNHRNRLTSVLLVAGALAGAAACSQSEPSAAYPPANTVSSGGTGMGGYTTTGVRSSPSDPAGTMSHGQHYMPGSSTYVPPGNGAAGFDTGLSGTGTAQGAGGTGMGSPVIPNTMGTPGSTGTSSTGATPSTPGSTWTPDPANPANPPGVTPTPDSDPMGTNASSPGNPTGTSNRPRTGTTTRGTTNR